MSTRLILTIISLLHPAPIYHTIRTRITTERRAKYVLRIRSKDKQIVSPTTCDYLKCLNTKKEPWYVKYGLFPTSGWTYKDKESYDYLFTGDLTDDEVMSLEFAYLCASETEFSEQLRKDNEEKARLIEETNKETKRRVKRIEAKLKKTQLSLDLFLNKIK